MSETPMYCSRTQRNCYFTFFLVLALLVETATYVPSLVDMAIERCSGCLGGRARVGVHMGVPWRLGCVMLSVTGHVAAVWPWAAVRYCFGQGGTGYLSKAMKILSPGGRAISTRRCKYCHPRPTYRSATRGQAFMRRRRLVYMRECAFGNCCIYHVEGLHLGGGA